MDIRSETQNASTDVRGSYGIDEPDSSPDSGDEYETEYPNAEIQEQAVQPLIPPPDPMEDLCNNFRNGVFASTQEFMRRFDGDMEELRSRCRDLEKRAVDAEARNKELEQQLEEAKNLQHEHDRGRQEAERRLKDTEARLKETEPKLSKASHLYARYEKIALVTGTFRDFEQEFGELKQPAVEEPDATVE